MNKQKVYNTVKKHLLKQNEISMVKGVCLYRGPNGLKCALGIFIPDNKYHRYLEGISATALIDDGMFKLPGNSKSISDSDLNLLNLLQGVHDTFRPPKWKEELRRVAEIFHLKP